MNRRTRSRVGKNYIGKKFVPKSKFLDGRAQFVRRREFVELREQADGERMVSGISAFVFREPALFILPLDHAR